MSTFLRASLVLSGVLAIASVSPAQAAVTTECQVQPREGQPSPLAMRALFTLKSTADGNVTAVYTNLPTPVAGETQPVTIAQSREMVFYKTTIPAVRDRMLKNPALFTELRGFSEPQGFKPFNDLLVCKSVGAATPQPGTAIADLVDGTYRYWTGKPSMTVTDKQLLETGAYTFVFTKEGNQVYGFFARPNDLSMCVRGTIKGNLISGVVNPPAKFSSSQGRAMQNKAFDPAGHLKLGAWEEGNLGAFNPSSLDLSKFSRINVGSRKPSSKCM